MNAAADLCKGRAAGDSPENLGMRSFINNLVQNGKGVQMFIDVHSYAQLFMTRKSTHSVNLQSKD